MNYGAISDPAVLDGSSEELKISLALRLIDCFLHLVKGITQKLGVKLSLKYV
jgi:hypothetical protein